jgi:hypothetical protein
MTERKGKFLSGSAGKLAAAASLCLLLTGLSLAQERAQDPQHTQGEPNAAPQTGPTTPTTPGPSGPFDAFGRWINDSVATAGAGISAAWRGTVTGIGGIGNQAGTAAKGAGDAANNVAKGAADVAKGAADVAKGAANVANTAVHLPVSRIAAGRERCIIAPNGAPDCRGAAEALCKSKGFNTGTSVDFENVENCPAQVLLENRRQEERHCPTDYFVTRSLCQ